jgi:hypothetical protein
MTFINQSVFAGPFKKIYTNVIHFKGAKPQITTTVNSKGIKYYISLSE